eukprot:m.215328 g.215328  ORF g.215328 m.215328 type:complete len:194 (-) comp19092_c0_seq3:347-928(-)
MAAIRTGLGCPSSENGNGHSETKEIESEESHEMRLIPESDTALDAMFAALSACQALHPDDDDDDECSEDMLDMMYTADNLPNGAEGGVRGVGEGFLEDACDPDVLYDAENDTLTTTYPDMDGDDDSMYADADEETNSAHSEGNGVLAGLLDQGFVTSECEVDIEMTPEGAATMERLSNLLLESTNGGQFEDAE